MNMCFSMFRSGASRARRRIALSLLSLVACFALVGCSTNGPQAEEDQAAVEEQLPSHRANGSVYEKAETISVGTSLTGEVRAVAVDEWIKNPDGLDEIEDESSLQQIASDNEVSFSQEGGHLTWDAKGNDVHYTGVTDKELPFSISYSYKLDGREVDPSELKGATGHVEVVVSYVNKTSATINVGGSERRVTAPFVMAALVSFDAEHAKNVSVTKGQVIDQEGSYMAVGLAMPGLGESLGLDGLVDLPESVTFSADVMGFEMPSITTMATDRALGSFVDPAAGKVSDAADDVFSKMGTMTEAVDKLAQGNEGVSTALSSINEGQSKLNEAFPNTQAGFDQIAEAESGVGALIDASSAASGQSASHQQEAADALASLKQSDTTEWSEEQIAALDEAIASLEESQTALGSSAQSLEKASAASEGIVAALGKASEGLAQIQKGYEQLEEATGQVGDAAGKLSEATQAMGENVKKMISQAQGGIEEKLDTVEALADFAESQGALCGNAEAMPASTTYVVTAQESE